ncbi:hypothetical protein [Lactiplantibacillus plantarum]
MDPDDAEVFAYRRHYQSKTLLVISNFTANTVTRDYDQGKADKLVISNYDDDQGTELRLMKVRSMYLTRIIIFGHKESSQLMRRLFFALFNCGNTLIYRHNILVSDYFDIW